MINMKVPFNNIYAILFLILITSCTKYENGPHVSLRTKNSRICGEWKIKSLYVNSIEMNFDPAIGYHFNKGGVYHMHGTTTDDGKWDLKENGEVLLLISNSPNTQQQSFKILRLRNLEIWWKQTLSSGDIQEVHLIQ